jgi:hypothetical protein
MVSTLALLLATGTRDPAFGWVLLAFLALLAMHAVYWLATHPTNKFWLKDQELRGLGAGFFALGGGGKAIAEANPDAIWTALRNRWEYSHVARAALAAIALLALVVATAI